MFVAESTFLTVFVIDIILNLIAYGKLYLKDCWNILDGFFILVSIGFMFLDGISTESTIWNQIIKLRGFVRIVRVIVLYRKFTQIHKQNERRKRMEVLKLNQNKSAYTP